MLLHQSAKVLPLVLIGLGSLFSSSTWSPLGEERALSARTFDGPLTPAVDPILGDLLAPHPSRVTRLSSSHDPVGGNRDNDCDNLPLEGDYLQMFSAQGEGRITRLWMNADYDYDIVERDDWREMWIIADGETVFRGNPLDWFNGKAGYVAPLVLNQDQSSGAFVSWVPIPYKSYAKILVRGYPHYFQVSHREGPGSANGPTPDSVSRFLSDAWWTRSPAPDSRAKVTREAALTLATGPVLVTELALTFAPEELARLRIRIGDQPAFPATYLFGFGAPRTNVPWPTIDSALVHSDPSAHVLSTRLPIPLREGEALVVETDGPLGPIDLGWSVTQVDDAITRANGAHLVAQYREQGASGLKTTAPVFEAGGSLELVSFVEELSDGVHGDRDFLEGDEMIRVDGMTHPIQLGTGTEDYFNSGWYFNTGEHTNPLSGLSRLVVTDDEDGWGSALFEYSMHRHHVLDAPIARSGMRMGMEMGHDGTYPHLTMRTFALAYGFSSPREVFRRHFALAADEEMESSLDAESGEEPQRFGVRRGRSSTKLRMPCGPAVRGALIVRTYDAGVAPQQAAVFVAGHSRSTFYEAVPNPHRRLAQDERWVDIGAAECASGTLEIDISGMSQAWNESAYDVALYEP